MARLPSAATSPVRLPRAASGQVQYSGASPVGDALRQAGGVIGRIGESIAGQQAQESERTARFKARADFYRFKTEQRDFASTLPADGTAYRAFTQQYERGARDLLSGMPNDLRPELELSLLEEQAQLGLQVGRRAHQAQQDYYRGQIAETQTTLSQRVAADFTSLPEAKAEYDALVSSSGLEDDERSALSKGGDHALTIAAIAGRIGRDPDAFVGLAPDAPERGVLDSLGEEQRAAVSLMTREARRAADRDFDTFGERQRAGVVTALQGALLDETTITPRWLADNVGTMTPTEHKAASRIAAGQDNPPADPVTTADVFRLMDDRPEVARRRILELYGEGLLDKATARFALEQDPADAPHRRELDRIVGATDGADAAFGTAARLRFAEWRASHRDVDPEAVTKAVTAIGRDERRRLLSQRLDRFPVPSFMAAKAAVKETLPSVLSGALRRVGNGTLSTEDLRAQATALATIAEMANDAR